MVVGSFAKGCQVAVIGSGPGGYLAAIRLAQLKTDVILVEAEPSLGGICLNEGDPFFIQPDEDEIRAFLVRMDP